MQQKAENEGKIKGGSPVEQMEFQRLGGIPRGSPFFCCHSVSEKLLSDCSVLLPTMKNHLLASQEVLHEYVQCILGVLRVLAISCLL